jgi:hypothetical protein
MAAVYSKETRDVLTANIVDCPFISTLLPFSEIESEVSNFCDRNMT